MNTVIHQWLVDLEETLRRMIGGSIPVLQRLAAAMDIRISSSRIWPIMIHMARVSFWLCLWLAILFFPWMPGLVFHLAWWWKGGSLIWLAMASVGSYWGLKRLIKKRKASAADSRTADTTGSAAEVVLAVSVKEGHSRSGIQKR